MNALISKILYELGQSSTYQVLATVLGVLGVDMSAGTMQTITFVGMGVSGVVAILVKEGWQQAITSGDAVKQLQAELAAVKAQLPPKS